MFLKEIFEKFLKDGRFGLIIKVLWRVKNFGRFWRMGSAKGIHGGYWGLEVGRTTSGDVVSQAGLIARGGMRMGTI